MKKIIELEKKWWKWINFTPLLETVYRWVCEKMRLIQIIFDLSSFV